MWKPVLKPVFRRGQYGSEACGTERNGEHLMPAIGAARGGWHCAVKDERAGFISKNTAGITGPTSDLIAVNFKLAEKSAFPF
jgi:hypothetical protein